MENENNVINEIEDRSYREQILAIIRSDISDEEIKQALEEYHDNDIASVIEELTEEENDRLLHALGSEAMSEVVPYLDDAGEYLSELEADEAADIIEQMDADEALEVLEDLAYRFLRGRRIRKQDEYKLYRYHARRDGKDRYALAYR